MIYPTQSGTLNRLERETRKAGRQIEDRCISLLQSEWDACKAKMRAVVRDEYRRGFGSGTWDLARAGAILGNIRHFSQGHLMVFHASALGLIGQSIRHAYTNEALRQVWMLDSLTPPSYKPKLPKKALREASGDYSATWEQMLGEWLKAYVANLSSNLRLEALHAGDIEDSIDEVDAVKIKLPNGNFAPDYLFPSMITDQILQSQREARSDVADENDDIVAEEIFQTMEDARVCDDCDSQDGVPVDKVKVEGHVYMWNCRCFERIVPSDFAELLRDGTEDEKAAALDADARGLVPDAMAVKDADGTLKAHFTIDFDKWMGQQDMNIYGRAGAALVQ